MIACAVWLVNKKTKKKFCPICAGVVFTWLWLLIGVFLGFLAVDKYQLITGILMGGTIVGAMSKLEKLIEQKFILIWKTLFTISGFMMVYGLLSIDWTFFLVSAILIIIFTFVFKTKEISVEINKEIEEKMKNCC